jgi:NADH:ubiquinone oxidoreductase subunit 6 (subunit J)
MKELFLTIISFLILVNALMIIFNKNPIHSILFLVIVFVCTTGLLIIVGVEFIAMLFLVVYVGAITVLFLFVVMMLNIKIIELNERFISYIPIGIFIGLIFLLEVLFLISVNLTPLNYSYFEKIDFSSNYFLLLVDYFNILHLTNIEQIANILYTKFVYLFILSGLILLIAMIGSIILTLNERIESKRQDIYIQNNRQITQAIKHLF